MPAWAEWPRYRPPRSQGLLVVQRLGDIAMKQTGKVLSVRLSAIAFALIATQRAFADDDESGGCFVHLSQAQMKAALVSAVTLETSGINFQMWSADHYRDGAQCSAEISGDS